MHGKFVPRLECKGQWSRLLFSLGGALRLRGPDLICHFLGCLQFQDFAFEGVG